LFVQNNAPVEIRGPRTSLALSIVKRPHFTPILFTWNIPPTWRHAMLW